MSKFCHIVVVTFNRIKYTEACLHSLFSKDAGYPYKVTIVDNASTDGTVDFLNKIHQHENIKEICFLKENKGISYASNYGWYRGPKDYYMKYDNDMIVEKDGWLANIVEASDKILISGEFGYNVEQVSYKVQEINGLKVRPKLNGNLGGACVLIPYRTFKKLGYWYQFGERTYGEEDSEFSARVAKTGMLNIYMEDENAFTHLPGGKADMPGEEREYREYKDEERRKNLLPGSWYTKRMREVNEKKNLFVNFRP